MNEIKFNLIKTPPPFHIYQKCVNTFGVSFEKGIIFVYGNNIYCINDLSDHHIAHEVVHIKQQAKIGKDIWWDRYFTDPLFRLEQEAEAYQAQWKFLMEHCSRPARRTMLKMLVKDLSGPMYSRILSKEEARKVIMNI